MDFLVPLCAIAAIWGIFIGLPLVFIYFRLKNRFENALSEQQRRFEQQLRTQRPPVSTSAESPSPTPSSTPSPQPAPVFSRRAEIPEAAPIPNLSLTPSSPSSFPNSPPKKESPLGMTLPMSGLTSKQETPLTSQPTAPSKSSVIADKPSIDKPSIDKPIADTPSADKPNFSETSIHQNSPPAAKRAGESVSLETQVGRKLFGWTAVVLFVLGGAFFVQLAVQRGWLNPMNRLIGMALLGTTFLALGRFLFRKGQRRFSETFNSTGIVTFLLTGYYAHFAHLFSDVWATTLLVATAFGGFLLAGLYQSRTIGLVATLGGLAIPFLIPGEGSFPNLCVYLAVYFASVLLLVFYLGRAQLALLGWLGTLAIFHYAAYCSEIGPPLSSRHLSATMLFLAVFWGLNFLDSCRVVFHRRSISDSGDLLRALVTPFLFFIEIRILCLQNKGETLFGEEVSALFDRFGGLFAFALFLIYLTAALCFAWREKSRVVEQLRRAAETTPSAGALHPTRSGFVFSSLSGQVSVARVLAFAFLAAAIPLALSRGFVGVAFLTLAAGLIVSAAAKSVENAFAKNCVDFPSELAEKLRTLYAQKRLESAKWFAGASVCYFFIGLEAIVSRQLLPGLYPVGQFLAKTTVPFFNAAALPTLLCGAVLVLGMTLAVYYLRREKSDKAEGAAARTAFSFCARFYGIAGGLLLWALATSEIFAFFAVFFHHREIPRAGLFAAASVPLLWLLIAALLFTLGERLQSRAVRGSGVIVLGACVLKLIFVNLPHYPLIGLVSGLVSGLESGSPGPAFFAYHFPSEISAAMTNLRPEPFLTPIFNPVALPYFVTAVVLMLFGVRLRNALRYRERAEEYQAGLILGFTGLVLLLGIFSLEYWSWFENRADVWRQVTFYAPRALWILGLVSAAFLWRLGIGVQSRAIRLFALLLLLVETPFVFGGEFCVGQARTNGEAIVTLGNRCAIPAALFALYTLFFGVVNSTQSAERKIGPDQRRMATVIGVLGTILLITLLSFEVYRYCSGKTWFGPSDWTRLVALSILWSAAAALLALLGKARRSLLLRVFSVVMLLILAGKLFLLEVGGHPIPITPFLNVYAFGTLLTAVTTISVACFLLSGLRRLASKQDQSERGCGERISPTNAKGWEFYLYQTLLGLGVVEFWLASSVDLFESVRLFPAEAGREPIFLAQMSLSILWSVIAGTLLAVGFWKKSALLRWMAILLFGVATLKVLTVDLAHVDQLYRVAAFFVLAIALAASAAAYHFRRGASET